MAQHWSRFVSVSEKQAYAIDRMVEEHKLPGDGCDLLARLGGISRSKVGKLDRLQLRPLIDEAFRSYGR